MSVPEQPKVNVTCPFCQAQLAVPASQAGAMASCPSCDGNFQVPVPTAAPGVGGGYAPGGPVQEFAGKKVAAGVCGIVIGSLGVHKFILGLNTSGVIMLVVSLVGVILGSCLVVPILATSAMGIIGIIEGIIYLTKSDEEFYQTYAVEKKEWF